MGPFAVSFFGSDIKDGNVRLDFRRYADGLVFGRLKLVSLFLVLAYPLFFFVDLFLLRDLVRIEYRINLFIIHTSCFIVSAIFLYLQKRVDKLPKRAINYTYISVYLLIGAIATLNSQLVTGTIAAYLIVLIASAATFPIRPLHYFIMVAAVHGFFVIGLSIILENSFLVLTKQLNATGAAVISLLICYSFYSFQKQNFIHEHRLRSKEESFRRLFSMNPSPLILANFEDNKIILMNRQATDYFQTGDKPISMLNTSFIFPSPAERLTVLKQLQDNESVQNFIMAYEDSRWAVLNFERVEYMEEPCMLIGVSDITAFKKKEEELHRHASLDALTGIMNRRCGIEILEQLVASSEGRAFTLCFVDINDLKMVNDLYGHAVGDEMIKLICTAISGKISADDVFFRLGGDEFVILFMQKNLEEARNVLDSITVELELMNVDMQNDYQLSASYGLYHYQPGSQATADELIELADKEMYKEKSVKPISR
ncbi:GGDEF domain-containing protein [Neobacillus notoginsengisoli]|nr:GGDEF domain-containing protein [Neobacillus notoginsengisoli]